MIGSKPAQPGRRKKISIIFLAVAIAGMATLYFTLAGGKRPGAPVGYAMPLAETASAKLGWRGVVIDRPIPLYPGQKLTLPEGQEIAVYDASTGVLEAIRGPASRKIQLSSATEDFEHLSTPLAQLLTTHRDLPPDPDGMGIVITSPVSVTRFRVPILDWRSKEGVLYDVAIVDPDDPMAPPRRVRGVRPPISSSQLETTMRPELATDRIFGVLVRESANQNTIGANGFLTTPDADASAFPTMPSALMSEAINALARPPYRVGDAHTALRLLPAPWRETELAIRLRWKIALELRDRDELKALASLSPSR